MIVDEKKRLFNKILFRWHRTHYRDMPWRPPKSRLAGSGEPFSRNGFSPKSRRRDRASLDPYRILVSEIMLQQTQVERVRGKYVEFLKKFPNSKALAQSPLGDVLRAWSGLGYNTRSDFPAACRVVPLRKVWKPLVSKIISCRSLGHTPSACRGVLDLGESYPQAMCFCVAGMGGTI